MSASFQKILIAVDGEPVAAHAAEIGIQMANCLKAEVAFIHAVDPALIHAPGVASEELLREAEREGRRMLDALPRGVGPSLTALQFIRIGKAAHEILTAAKEWPADLIVMGSHGRHGIPRVLLGSVAEAVMRHAPCPVLVVRARTER
jgi:nucleotide-binding universal stress UspA family protein